MKRYTKLAQFLLRLFLVAVIAFLSNASMFSRLWAATIPFVAYDGQNQTRIAYDGDSLSPFTYDPAAVPITDSQENRTVETSGLFGEFTEFLAAQTAVPTGNAYTVVFQTTLDSASYPGLSRAAHFQEANEALLTAMESDPQFAQTMQYAGVNLDRAATGLAPRTPPNRWTWHHAQDRGVMQLVPRSQHTPGSIFWETLHPDGRGGYSIWGQQ
jgi:hypothetical protein